MARSNAVALRAAGADRPALPILPSASIIRRVVWILCAGAWVFALLSLASFSAADWPSHVVAVHNEPPANLGGHAGAVVAYTLLRTLGIGSWIVVAAVGGALGVTATGRQLDHPIVRLVGVLLMAAAVSGLHALWMPGAGSLTGLNAGAVGIVAISELTGRFGTTIIALVLVSGFAVGAVIAADELVMAAIRRLPVALAAVMHALRLLDPRPAFAAWSRWRHARAVRKAERELARASGPLGPVGRRRRVTKPEGAIDENLGGLGATESFDPDESDRKRRPKRAAVVTAIEEEDDDDVLDDEELVDEEEWEEEEEDEDELLDEDEEDEEDEEEEDEDEDEDEEVDGVHAGPRALTTEELKAKIAKLPLRMTGRTAVVARDEDIPRQENFEGYRFPTLDLLEDPEGNYTEKMEAFVREQAGTLERTLQTFSIDAEVVGIESGPVVTLFSIQLAPGTRVARLQAISSDIARSLQAQNIRIIPNMAGKTTVGIEVPNLHKEKVRLKELMSGGHAAKMALPMFLGKDASGEPLVADLARMPHMLIAGTTGSGKSVCMNSIIMSWLYTKRPDELKVVLVDPKMVEMSQFSEIPHLMCPVVTEMSRAAAILEWAVNKMEERYELLKEAMVRDIAGYNSLSEEELLERFEPENEAERARIPRKLPYLVFVIDELADLMMTNKEVEHSIVRIAQKARAVGIHLIVATQRPQANVVTGLIKSNMPCRISFKVASGMDSRIVLDAKGAELLLGQGDMLFLTPHTSELRRAQGTLVTDAETRKVVRYLRDVATPSFERSLMSLRASSADGEEGGLSESERDPLFDKAVEIMIETGRGSVSLLQRRLAIGYSRASRLVDQMGLAGILGDHKGSVAREVLITLDDWRRMKAMEEAEAKAGTLFEEGEPATADAAASGD